jgi:predicted permease
MLTEIRHVCRRLINSPGFTATALATLALCLGANLAIFAVVDAILVRSLPFADPGRLVVVYNSYPGAGVERAAASMPNYFDRRNAIKAFSSVALFTEGSITVGGNGSPSRVVMARVSPKFFATLGVPLAMGREFTDDQLTYGADEVAVLTDEFWHSHFGASRDVIGSTFINDGISIKVIGVLPKGFYYLSSHAQFYRPTAHGPDDLRPQNRHSNGWEMIARLAPGATLVEAQAQIDAFNAAQLKDDPFANLIKGAGYHTVVAPLREDHVRTVKPTLVLLQVGGLFLLLIGGVNLANLLLIRAGGRTKEYAVRQALGAGRLRIARDAVIETTVIALGGGLLGLLLAAFGIRLFGTLGTNQLPLGSSIQLDARVAAVSIAAALVAGVLLSGPIIWLTGHMGLAHGLQSEGRGGTSGRAAQRLRHGFIVAQVALAFVLLAGAGLLGLSLKRVLDTPRGFRTDSILTGQIALPWKNYKDEASRLAFVERLLPAIRALPGAAQVAINTGLPFAGNVNDSAVVIEGLASKPGDVKGVRAHYIPIVSGDYWSMMGIPLIRGRLLEDADNHRPLRVCVVDRSFAERYWPGGSPLGHRIDVNPIFGKDTCETIVGEVASAKQNDLSEDNDHGTVYLPFKIFSPNGFYLLVRTRLPTAAMAPMIQKAILQLDPELPIDDLRPMQTRIDDSLVARRSPAILAGIFAGIALLLAAIGTYGVLAYAVSQRRREIGVRMALGALPQQVLGHFLGLGAVLLGAGLVLGVILAWFAGRAMQGLLFGVGALQPAVIAATTLTLAAVVFLAIFLPSRRAARVNPIDALREE